MEDKKETPQEEIKRLKIANKYSIRFFGLISVLFIIMFSVNIYLNNDILQGTNKIIFAIDDRTNTMIQLCAEQSPSVYEDYRVCIETFVPLPDDIMMDLLNG